MTDPLSVLICVGWAVVTLAGWSLALWHRVTAFRTFRDTRAMRSVLSGFALWMTAFLFSAALIVSVLVDVGTISVTLRSTVFGVGLGAFAAAGVLSGIEPRNRE